MLRGDVCFEVDSLGYRMDEWQTCIWGNNSEGRAKSVLSPREIQGTIIFLRRNSLHPRIYRLSFVFQLPCGESYGTEAFCEVTGITEEGITACVSVRSKEKPQEMIGKILRER